MKSFKKMGNFGRRDTGAGRRRESGRRDDAPSTGFDRRKFERPTEGRGRFEKKDFGGKGFQKKFKVTCDGCGEPWEVPFQPTGNKPVYCSDCFRKQPRTTESSPRSSGSSREGELEQINRKLDKIMKALKIH